MKRNWWMAGLIVITGLLGIGVLLLITRPPRGKAIILLPPPTPAPLMVFVSGAVNQAGLYSLPAGSRVNDAIQAAGGFSEGADASLLNLAQELQDGEQIDVPVVVPIELVSEASARHPGSRLVNINTATVEELDTLPDIGPKTAQLIIDYRTNNGPFSKVEDIIAVSGIGQATFDKIKDLITVGMVAP